MWLHEEHPQCHTSRKRVRELPFLSYCLSPHETREEMVRYSFFITTETKFLQSWKKYKMRYSSRRRRDSLAFDLLLLCHVLRYLFLCHFNLSFCVHSFSSSSLLFFSSVSRSLIFIWFPDSLLSSLFFVRSCWQQKSLLKVRETEAGGWCWFWWDTKSWRGEEEVNYCRDQNRPREREVKREMKKTRIDLWCIHPFIDFFIVLSFQTSGSFRQHNRNNIVKEWKEKKRWQETREEKSSQAFMSHSFRFFVHLFLSSLDFFSFHTCDWIMYVHKTLISFLTFIAYETMIGWKKKRESDLKKWQNKKFFITVRSSQWVKCKERWAMKEEHLEIKQLFSGHSSYRH